MISQARLKYLRSLSRKKVRREEGVLLVEGLRLVQDAVACGYALEIYAGPDVPLPRGLGDLPVHTLEQKDVGALADTETPQGVFALCRDPCAALGDASLPPDALVLVAHGVADPGNLGTLVRSAAALGAHAVVTTPGTVEPTNPKAVRASAGALFRCAVLRGELEQLRELGFGVLVASTGGAPLAEMRARPRRLALVVGNEPRGVDAQVQQAADGTVAIPLSAGVDSLNVAAAAAVLLYALAALPMEPLQ